MRVMITGHLGYIGPTMIRTFKEGGHTVVGLDTGYFKECIDERFGATPPDEEIRADVRDVEEDALRGIDAIVHLAALSNDPMGQLDPGLTHDINHQASVRLARMAKAAGVSRFVFASSCSTYGAAGDCATPLDEQAPFNPVSAYAVSKVGTERDLLPLADESFAPVFMRNATAYGLSPRMRFDLVLNNLVGWARTSNAIRVMSDGTPWRPMVHIEDISLAAYCAATAPARAVAGQAFNVGRSDCNYQVRDIAEIVSRQVPGSELVITGETGGDSRSYKVSFDKALNELPGFRPRWTLEMGAEEIDRWLIEKSLTTDEFQSRFYIRLKQLNHLRESAKLSADLHWI